MTPMTKCTLFHTVIICESMQTVNVVWWPFNKTIFLKKCLPCVFFVLSLAGGCV